MGNNGKEVGCPWGFGAAVMHGGVEEFLGLVWVVVIKLISGGGFRCVPPNLQELRSTEPARA